MKLQTQVPLKKQSENSIDYNANILLLGSCFVDNIGDKLSYYKFKSLQNAFGVLFHPKAIETLVSRAVKKECYTETDLFFHNEQWHSFDAHSRLSSLSKDTILQALNAGVEQTHDYLKKATHVVLTLGTAWVYKTIETEKIVANCHKVSQKAFQKVLLSVNDIVESLEVIIQLIKKANPKATIIFTVSPIRHLKDGFIENTQSKAHLVTAIHKLINTGNKIIYFPSYEIMMDELRDYRFYAEDMIHPSPMAVHYIWERFKAIWIAENAFKTMQEVEYIQKGLKHRPFNENSEQHKRFISNLEVKQKELAKLYSHIVF